MVLPIVASTNLKELNFMSSLRGRASLLTLLYKWGKKAARELSCEKAALSPGSLISAGSKVTALLPPTFPLSMRVVDARVPLGFHSCGSDTVTQLHGKTLSYPLVLPASRRASGKVHLNSPLSSSGACSESSSHLMGIMAGDTDLLTLEET